MYIIFDFKLNLKNVLYYFKIQKINCPSLMNKFIKKIKQYILYNNLTR